MKDQELDLVALSEAMQQLKALIDLMTALNEDVVRFKDAVDNTGRRALVRAVFAYIEGTSFGFRTAAFHLSRMRNVQLDIGEMMMAREITYALNDKGQVEEKQALSSPLANVRFALTLFAKVSGATYEFPAGDSKFEQLRKAQRLRNRLTHPRSSAELEVTTQEQAVVIQVKEWIDEQQTKVLMAFAFRLHSGLDRTYDKIKALPRMECGGYSAVAIGNLFAEGLQTSHPIPPERVEEWLASLLELRKSEPEGG